MSRPYSSDLRERVLAACREDPRPRREIARQFRISRSILYDWLRRWRSTGSFQSKPHAGGPAAELDRGLLRQLVEENSDRTLAEYAALYQARTGRRFSISLLSRALKQMDLPRKKRPFARASNSGPRLQQSE